MVEGDWEEKEVEVQRAEVMGVKVSGWRRWRERFPPSAEASRLPILPSGRPETFTSDWHM